MRDLPEYVYVDVWAITSYCKEYDVIQYFTETSTTVIPYYNSRQQVEHGIIHTLQETIYIPQTSTYNKVLLKLKPAYKLLYDKEIK